MASAKVIKAAEEEIKAVVLAYFTNNFDDEYGYVTEKREKIESLDDGEAWVAFRLVHMVIRVEIYSKLSEKARKYLIDNDEVNEFIKNGV